MPIVHNNLHNLEFISVDLGLPNNEIWCPPINLNFDFRYVPANPDKWASECRGIWIAKIGNLRLRIEHKSYKYTRHEGDKNWFAVIYVPDQYEREDEYIYHARDCEYNNAINEMTNYLGPFVNIFNGIMDS